MALARIYTSTPREAQPLVESLRSEGYKVEVVPPGQVCRKRADLEFNLDLEAPAAAVETSVEPALPAPPEMWPQATTDFSEPQSQVTSFAEPQPPAAPEYSEYAEPRPGLHLDEVRGRVHGAVSEAWHASQEALHDMRNNVHSISERTASGVRPAGEWFTRQRASLGSAMEQFRASREAARERRESARAGRETLRLEREQQRAVEHAEQERFQVEQEHQREAGREAERIRREAETAEYERIAAAQQEAALARNAEIMEPNLPAQPVAMEPVSTFQIAPVAVTPAQQGPRPAHRTRAKVRRRAREWRIAFASAGVTAAILIIAFALGANFGGRQLPTAQPASQTAPFAASPQAVQPQSAGVTLGPAQPAPAPAAAQAAAAPASSGGATISPGKGVTINAKPKPRPRRAASEDGEAADDVVVYHHRRKPPARGEVAQRNGVRKYTDVD